MKDPIAELQSTETFRKLDRRVNWAYIAVFAPVVLLIAIAVGKNVVFA